MKNIITNAQITSECPAFAKPMLAEVPLSGVTISEVYLMDCVEGMKHYPDKYFDLAVVDPPYGLGIDGQKLSINKNPKHNRKEHTKKNWDNEIPTMQYFLEVFRVSKNQIIWGGNYFVEHLNMGKKGWLVWDKRQYGLTMSDCELAYSSFDYATRIYNKNRSILAQEGTIHPTQKPIGLYDFCFDFAKLEKGAKVIDTHLGSGSSRISANKNGLNFVGFEIDEEYFNKQNKRYADFTAQLRLDF